MPEGSSGNARSKSNASALEADRHMAPEMLEGRVKWFDPERGFGFVRSHAMDRDILLHANVLNKFGQSSIASGSAVKVRVQEGSRGLQATEVISIEGPEPEGPRSTASALTDPTRPVDVAVPYLPARVKWFDGARGFGFANAFRMDEDILLHVKVLRRFGLDDLATGEAICLRAVNGENGLVAIEVRRWNFVPSSDAAFEPTSPAAVRSPLRGDH